MWEESELMPAPGKIQLQFKPLERFYDVGDFIAVELIETAETNRFQRVDLWVAVQLPTGELFFKTPLPIDPFSLIPQAFKTSVESADRVHTILEFEVLPNIGGDYIFYALYVEEGSNPLTDGFTVLRSNLAYEKITLANQ